MAIWLLFACRSRSGAERGTRPPPRSVFLPLLDCKVETTLGADVVGPSSRPSIRLERRCDRQYIARLASTLLWGGFECAASRHVIFLRHFFLIKTTRAIVDHRPIRIGNRQWSSVAKIAPPRSGRRLPVGNPCAIPRAARLAIAGPAFWSGRRRGSPSPISRRAPKGSAPQRTRRIIAQMLAIDPPAGFSFHSQIRSDQRSDDRRAHDDDPGRRPVAMDRTMGDSTPLSRLRAACAGGRCGSRVAPAPRRSPLPARDEAPVEAEGKLFLPANP